MANTGEVALGLANMFSIVFMSGASNPDRRVAYCATGDIALMSQGLGGESVMWGGREGWKRCQHQHRPGTESGRFISLVVDTNKLVSRAYSD
jgi:xylose isomerase